MFESLYFQAKFIVYMNGLNHTFNPEYVVVELFVTNKGSESPDWAFSANFNYTQPIPFLTASVKLTQWDYGTSGANARTILNINFDFCKMVKRKNKSDIFLNFAFATIAKFGDMPKECPLRQKSYQFVNVSFKDLEVPFANLFLGRGDGIARLTAFTKKKNQRIEIFDVNLLMGYKNI